MSLLSDYQARYSSQIRVNLSNPQGSSATSVNATNETNAALDAAADFQTVCGQVYDSANAVHVAAGVPLVMARLLLYTGQADRAYLEAARKDCRETYALVLGRNRIPPTTDSPLTVTTEPQGSRPASDLPVFNRYVGNSPGGAATPSDPSRPRLD